MRAAGLLAMLASAACAREPAEAVCPDLAEGDLVLTELRGPQSPEDAAGAWIELYNATGAPIDLAGVKVRFRRRTGGSEIAILVRHTLVIPAAAYMVLGLFDDADRPPHVDYGFLDDFDGSWLGAAAIDVETCGRRIDLFVYDALPAMGTFSLGGAPDADRNDLTASWCIDATQVGATFPGTPGSQNVTCPP